MVQLKTLSLAQNQIGSLPDFVFALPRLDLLDASQNRLT
jgi:Leucine-rich repeat (LRR) protein